MKILEKVHQAGFTYNDMKLDNILVGDYLGTPETLHEIRIIDFGFAARYRDTNGDHIKQLETNIFRSNMIFATSNQFEFKASSRRDDMISMCYLLIFLFKGGLVPFIAPPNLSKRDIFNYIHDVKKKTTNAQFCEGLPSGEIFLEFMDHIFSLKFDERPKYDLLVRLLNKCLVNINEEADHVYDWNQTA